MLRSRWLLLIPCLAAGLLLAPRGAKAQLVVTGPDDAPAAVALTAWFDHHVPVRFRGHGRFEVHPLTNPQMEAYLQSGDTDTAEGQSSHADEGEIDGVFEDDPPRITLRVPEGEEPDTYTFAHEYGHYVWYDLLTNADRDRYAAVYKKQKAAHHLVTRYAQTDAEEGFAEAFSFYVSEPPLLRHRDSASYQFLNTWTAPAP